MAAESARRGKLTQAVPHHVFSDINRHVPAAIMHRDRVPDHLREDYTGPAPGTDDLFIATLVHLLDFLEEIVHLKLLSSRTP